MLIIVTPGVTISNNGFAKTTALQYCAVGKHTKRVIPGITVSMADCTLKMVQPGCTNSNRGSVSAVTYNTVLLVST